MGKESQSTKNLLVLWDKEQEVLGHKISVIKMDE